MLASPPCRIPAALAISIAVLIALSGCVNAKPSGRTDQTLDEGYAQVIDYLDKLYERLPGEVFDREAGKLQLSIQDGPGSCGGSPLDPDASSYKLYSYRLNVTHPVDNDTVLGYLAPTGPDWRLVRKERSTFRDDQPMLEATYYSTNVTLFLQIGTEIDDPTDPFPDIFVRGSTGCYNNEASGLMTH
ncbi:hypothetical protein ACFVWR_11970 [Leifsonia sp. NPDC058292]|uniref:hypothetical protein n=1 Tax=Leifsonia sp. NPDC058292 TaxID=3346428 RepID=UPI0036DDC81D